MGGAATADMAAVDIGAAITAAAAPITATPEPMDMAIPGAYAEPGYYDNYAAGQPAAYSAATAYGASYYQNPTWDRAIRRPIRCDHGLSAGRPHRISAGRDLSALSAHPVSADDALPHGASALPLHHLLKTL